MRKGPLCLMLVTLSIMAPAHGEETTEGGSSTPLSLSAGSQITELQQRLKESERLREELKLGKPLKAALHAAYDRAFSAIFDGHMTSLITAVILFWLGGGTIKGFAVSLTIGIIASLAFDSFRFFQRVPIFDFLFGTQWSPQIAIRADQVGSTGAFGAVPLFAGTLLIMAIAMCVAAPIGLLSAIYLSEYAGRGTRAVVKPLLEILAGVPTVVYGFFAALTGGPLLRVFFNEIGLFLIGGPLDGLGHYLALVQNQMALTAGAVMGIMLIPFVSSLSDDILNAVPQTLRDGSFAMGATKSETVKRVLLPAALPGIAGALLLAVSRAIGETMIVTMAAGLAANLTFNPLDTVTTVTVQIVTLLTGDQEFNSAKTLSAFGLGLTLFLVTLLLNIIAHRIVQTYREQYD